MRNLSFSLKREKRSSCAIKKRKTILSITSTITSTKTTTTKSSTKLIHFCKKKKYNNNSNKMSGSTTWTCQLPSYPCNTFYGEQHHQRQQQQQHQRFGTTPSPFINFVFVCPDEPDNKTNDLYFKSPFITMNDIFHREDERLKTFENWPLSWLDKKQLAQTGMFYTGDDDKVKCYFCEVEIGRWECEDQPVPEHLRWSPNCPLLRRRTTNNVPIDNDELNQILPPESYDICGANDAIEVRNNSDASSTAAAAAAAGGQSQQQQVTVGTSTITAATSTATSPRLLNCSSSVNTATVTNYYPEYPEYAIEAARVRSFSEWPRHMKQTPIQMAEAGFFHSGIGDRVKCFSCGGGLKDWDDSDEPWEQHAIWLPKCRFVKLMKGESYIEAVVAKHKQQQQQQQQQQQNGEDDKEKPSCSVQTVMTATTSTSTNEMFMPEMTTTTGMAMTIPLPMATAETSAALATTMTTTTENAETSTELEQTTTAPATSLLCDKFNVCNEIAQRCSSSSKICSSSVAGNGNNNNITNIPEEKLCKICYANEYNTAFLPCGHVVACAKCASSVTKCPMCRKPFTYVTRVYFS